jgi:hypothetical protein
VNFEVRRRFVLLEVSKEERGLRVWERAIINIFLGKTRGKNAL